jgi:hypothetical protein
MKKSILSGLLACSLCFWGCYEDKGSYDYLPVNKVTISMPSAAIVAVMGDTLRYFPAITFANPNDTLGFEYWWEYRGFQGTNPKHEIIWEGRELHYMPRIVGAQILQFCVKEISSGVITVASLSVNGGSLYTKGWLILTETGGKSELAFVRPDRAMPGDATSQRSYVPYFNLYSSLFPGESLGSGPIAIRQAFSMRGIGEVFYVLQENESACLNGVSYQKEIKLSQEFVGGQPAGLIPIDYYQGHYSNILLNIDHKAYFRCPYYGSNTDFFTYSFANFPMEYQGKTLKIDRIIPSVAERVFHYAVYDKENKRFLWIYAGSVAGGLLHSTISNPPLTGELLDYNNTGDAEILYTSFYNEALVGSLGVAYNITVYAKGGEIYTQRCRSEGGQNLTTFPATGETLTEVVNNTFPNKEYITPDTKYYQLKTRTYLFFATGSTVYWYDHFSNQVHAFYDFPGDEVVDMSSNPQESELGVLLKNGKFVTLDIVNEHLMGTNNKLYEINIPGDRMVDLDYKFPNLTSYTSRTSATYWD